MRSAPQHHGRRQEASDARPAELPERRLCVHQEPAVRAAASARAGLRAQVSSGVQEPPPHSGRPGLGCELKRAAD